MKNKLCVIIGLLLLVGSKGSLFSQDKIEIKEHLISITKLFEKVESKSNYIIYSNTNETDTILVSISALDTPKDILEQAFEGTDLTVSVYENSLFVLKGKTILSQLPEWIYKTKEEKTAELTTLPATQDSTDYSSSFLLGRRQTGNATSELIVYEIGDVNTKISQSEVLNGYVIDTKTGKGVPGVLVYIEELQKHSVTNGKGHYSFPLLPGKYDLTISGAGVNETVRQIQFYSKGTLNIQTIEKVHALQEVTVDAERRNQLRQTTIGVEHLKMKDVKNIPTAFGEADIISIIKSLPGVKTVGEMSSGFNVRGGATDQNLIIFNEGTIYNPSHLFGLFSAFNPDVVDEFELYKSSIPSKYGGRISSVLDIKGRTGNEEKIKGTASIGLLTSRVALEGPIFKDKTTFLIGGRATYSDWLLNLLPSKSGYKDGNAGFYDFNAALKQKFGHRDNITINGYYSYDRFKFEKHEKYNYSNANLSVKWNHIFSSKLFGSLTAGYDHYDYVTKDESEPITAYDMKFAINQMYAKAHFVWEMNSQHTFNWGVNSILYNLEPGKNKPLGEESILIGDKLQREKAIESAIYIGNEWKITPKLAIDLGVRYTLFNVLGARTYNLYDPQYLPSLETISEVKENQTGIIKTYHGADFRVSGRYAITDNLSVKLGVNSMRQYIHKISNTSIMSPTDTWKLSDVNVKPQSGIQYAAGVYRNILDGTVEVSIEGYYKTMKDYLDYRNGARLLMNHNLETEVLKTSGRAYGIELMLKKKVGKLNGWISYTYARTQLKQDDKRTERPVNSGDWYSADFDKPHEVKLVGNYKFTQRYSFSFNIDYSTGRPITIPIAKYQHGNGESVYYSERNAHRVPDYFRTDIAFNIEPKHRIANTTQSLISFGIYNVTARKNAHSVYYKTEEGKIKGYKLSIFGAPIPYVSYSLKF